MGREKRLDQFPPEFFQLWDLAKQGKLRLIFPSKAAASTLRHRMYSFRTLLRKETSNLEYDTTGLTIQQEGLAWVLSDGKTNWQEQLSALVAQSATNNQE